MRGRGLGKLVAVCVPCVLFFFYVEQTAELLAAVGAAQQELEGVNRAHDELRRTHEELRSQAAAQARLLRELEVHAEAPSPTNAQVAVLGDEKVTTSPFTVFSSYRKNPIRVARFAPIHPLQRVKYQENKSSSVNPHPALRP